MLSVVQRVISASVVVESKIVGSISNGIMVLVCVETDDTEQNLIKMADKLLKYRIFEDDDGKMNLSVKDIGGGVLLVPQFTLAADTKKGTRPSFSKSCPPDIAKAMFTKFVDIVRQRQRHSDVDTGVFGADMKVSLINDGPVTFSFKV